MSRSEGVVAPEIRLRPNGGFFVLQRILGFATILSPEERNVRSSESRTFRGSSAAERLAVGNAASSGDIGMKQGELSGNPRASRAISSQASTFVEEGSETIPHGSTSPTCVGAGSALHPRSINSKRMKI